MKVVELFGRDGAVVPYRPLSARLPDFLREFGPEKGWRVVRTALPALEMYPGLLRLTEAAIAAKAGPETLARLPGLPESNQFCFRAELVDPNGNVVASATAFKVLREYKDLEAGETAAYQRLLAALGFGGDLLLEDETRDAAAQGLEAQAVTPTPPTPVTPPAPPAPPTPSAPAPDEAPAEEEIPVSVLRQIAHLRKVRGISASPPKTLTEAKAALAQLMAR